MFTYGITTVKLDFQFPVTCSNISAINIGITDPDDTSIAVVAALITSLIAEITVLPVWRPPYWISDFRVHVTVFRKPVPINMGIAVGISLISSLIAEICGFLFNSRHIGFLTSGYVWQSWQWHHWNGRPRKHGGSSWNFVPSWYRTWDTLGVFLPPDYT